MFDKKSSYALNKKDPDAMGNASNAVKEAADWVTNSCAEDGVYTALVALGLIE